MEFDLESRKWKEFKVKEIFSVIEKCKCSKVSELKKGTTPYVGATNRNNGQMSFVDAPKKITPGNCIVFICDGQGSIGYAIYKEKDFVGSTTLKVGRYNGINRYNANFIVSALDKNRIIYNYGYKRTENRLKNEIIYLPINEQGKPDYVFMEQYIRYIEESKKTQYLEIAKIRLASMKKTEIVRLEEKKWKAFRVTELFDKIQRGKRLTKANQIAGDMPYVSSTSLNNGVDNFVVYKEGMRVYSNCLSIANSGSVGSSFYEPFKYVASDHVTHLKNDKYNMYIYLFIATLTNRWSSKYNFNLEINDPRIAREKIVLPIDDNGNPDYIYMERYIKNLMIKKYEQYLELMSTKII